ncbi:MAG: homogentisate 1,2-dioxygenase [Candidatus Kapabacteria bacterium]|nr:homogentisate 1,2-dioxygenase [Candidatus Kapabacteria bacterium]
MAFYHKLGSIPTKKHITFYKDDGRSLYREELVSTKGFSGIYSTKYHINAPTKTLEIRELERIPLNKWDDMPLQHIHFKTNLKKSDGDFLTSRNIFLENPHCIISTAHPSKNSDYFYKNAYAHEYIFVHYGSGIFVSDYGKFNFEPGDQLVVPMGTIYQLNFNNFDNNKLLIVESDTAFEIPKHYRNEYGQLNEDAPYCERDFKLPEYFQPYDNDGRFKLIIKTGLRLFEYILPHHPFDVVGWDGYLYPYAFNIRDFAPKVGKLHLPPPVHLVFDTQHFVLCNFCPRLFDFHPEAIPVPYFHTNVESAEVLYYVEGDFMSRKGVGEGSITLHPLGLPHGPQPGKIEESLGAKETYEYAVMIDTFAPLGATNNVKETMDENYYLSWLD